MVKRLTSEPAEFFNVPAGSLEVGAQADLALLNPDALRSYDGEASIRYIYRDTFDCHQLVNRSDGVVEDVFIAGHAAWHSGEFTAQHGEARMGSTLRAGAG